MNHTRYYCAIMVLMFFIFMFNMTNQPVREFRTCNHLTSSHTFIHDTVCIYFLNVVRTKCVNDQSKFNVRGHLTTQPKNNFWIHTLGDDSSPHHPVDWSHVVWLLSWCYCGHTYQCSQSKVHTYRNSLLMPLI